MNSSPPLANPALARAALLRRGRRLEYVTMGWTILEACGGVAFGIAAASIALLGFGIDSMIEIASSAVLVWRLWDHSLGEQREKTALKWVGLGFLLLAAYLTAEAARDLLLRESPQVSYPGIVFAGLCLMVMPLLARAKRRVAAELSSRALHADSRQSDICAYLAAILLAGLGLNALFGWWWADSVAALAMVPIIAKEGIEALRGETCSCHE